MRVVNLACRAGAGDVFVTVEFVARRVPHRGLLTDAELGQFIDNGDIAGQRGLFGQFITKADPAIECAEPHRDLPRRAGGRREGHGEFIMLIPHHAALTPRLFPRRILGRADRGDDRKIAFKPVVFGKQHPEARRRDDPLAVIVDRIGRKARIITDGHGNLAIG